MGNDISNLRVPITVKNKTTKAIPAKGRCCKFSYLLYFRNCNETVTVKF